MRVSALIPTYNRGRQVLRAIDSVLAQTVPADEIIVVDDGSTDGTAEAIRSRYGSRIRLFRQENAGVAAARNRGVREARGEWIAFLDSDDLWLPTKIEGQFEALAALGSEFGLCFTDCAFEGSPDESLCAFHATDLKYAPKFGALEDPGGWMLAGREPFYTPSLLVLRSLLREIDGFDEGLAIGEDTDVIFRLSFKTRFCFVARPLVWIDRSPARIGGICSVFTTRNDRKYDSLERLYARWLTMPEVAGAHYERPVRDLLRLVCYDSAECKIHQLKIRSALREIARLRTLGDGYASIIGTLLFRKVGKLRRALRGPERRAVCQPCNRRCDV